MENLQLQPHLDHTMSHNTEDSELQVMVIADNDTQGQGLINDLRISDNRLANIEVHSATTEDEDLVLKSNVAYKAVVQHPCLDEDLDYAYVNADMQHLTSK